MQVQSHQICTLKRALEKDCLKPKQGKAWEISAKELTHTGSYIFMYIS